MADENERTDPEGGDGGGTDPEGGGGEDRTIPYDRFHAVVQERNTARRELKASQKENERLTTRIAELEADDQTETVRELQARVDEAERQQEEVEDYFSALLEAEIGELPEESRAMVEDVPGGARERFRYLTKHRARLQGTSGDTRPPGGPGNERKKTGDPPPPRDPAKEKAKKRAAGGYGAL